MGKYRTDAYEIAEKRLDRVVYAELANGNHITCVFSQLLDENGNLDNFTFDEKKCTYKQQKSINTHGGNN